MGIVNVFVPKDFKVIIVLLQLPVIAQTQDLNVKMEEKS